MGEEVTIQTPACPLCGELPTITIGGGTQAFCGNDGCTVIFWDPSRSLDQNLLEANFVDLRGWDLPREGSL
jgi:hypothetical protein